MEFYARGFHFSPVDIYRSDATHFGVDVENNCLIPPFSSMKGLGGAAAQGIVDARKDGEFRTIEELKERSGAGKTLLQMLRDRHVLDGIPETNQMTLF